jgi:hypothetical protein
MVVKQSLFANLLIFAEQISIRCRDYFRDIASSAAESFSDEPTSNQL